MIQRITPRLAQTTLNRTNPLLEIIGQALKTQREDRGWSIEQAARKSGIRKSALKKIEGGDAFIQFSKIANLCKLYNVHPNELY